MKKISNENLATLNKYFERRISNDNLLDSTVYNTRHVLTQFLTFLGDTKVQDVTEDIVYEYFSELRKHKVIGKNGKERGGYSKGTMYEHKSCIKKFLSYYVTEITIKNKPDKKRKLPEDILTETDVKRMIKACLHPRDSALIATLYETGCRRNELLMLQIKDFSHDKYGGLINIPQEGKTGSRTNRVVYCVSFLNTWLDVHPRKDDREAYLFCSLRKPFGILSKTGIAEQLTVLAARAGIKKNVTPHLFRHSRSTHLAKVLTEQQMKTYLGWTPGSSMASVYVHLSSKDLDNSLLKHYGVEFDDNEQADEFAVRQCQYCKEQIPQDKDVCPRCHRREGEHLAYDELKEKYDSLESKLNSITEMLEAGHTRPARNEQEAIEEFNEFGDKLKKRL
jgi:integrase/recombinase XerD